MKKENGKGQVELRGLTAAMPERGTFLPSAFCLLPSCA
jgi:hypothetical protein